MEYANSQNGIFWPSDENGAESFFWSFDVPIDLRPVLDPIQTALHNPSICWSVRRAELPSISLGTEVSGVELSSGVRAPDANEDNPKYLSEVRSR
jgi:hypothetical protein